MLEFQVARALTPPGQLQIELLAEYGKNQTAEDFVAMWWRYIHYRFAALDVNNVSWSWIVMGWQWSPSGNAKLRELIESMFPGPDYVDWISADLYNVAGNCSLSDT